MSQMFARCWHCGWACRRHNQVATDSVAVCCTMLFNLHCNIIVDYAEQLAMAVEEEIPKKSVIHYEFFPQCSEPQARYCQ
jgi:hypothetical protein